MSHFYQYVIVHLDYCERSFLLHEEASDRLAPTNDENSPQHERSVSIELGTIRSRVIAPCHNPFFYSL